MARQTQISGFISSDTKRELERYVEKKGLKKAYVLEQALQLHLRAMQELPAEVVVPAQLELSARSFDRVASRVKTPRKPTKAMKALFAKSSR